MRTGQTIRVKVPATIANMVCGFDVLGCAVEEPYDIFDLTLTATPGIVIENTDAFSLPTQPEQNVSGVSLQALIEECTQPLGFHLRSHKQIKPGSGLGSSAASAAGVVVAANALLGEPFSPEDLVRFAMHGEKLASGVKHADNIAPCIYGGVTLIRSIFPLDIVSLQSPPLFVSIVHPQIEVRTADARSVLKQKIFLKDAIRQWGNIAGLVAGFEKGDQALIGRSLEDVIIEPARSILIPGFDAVKHRAKAKGALGGGISGSGPSLFMFSGDAETAAAVADEMKIVFSALGLDHKLYVTRINTHGIQATWLDQNHS